MLSKDCVKVVTKHAIRKGLPIGPAVLNMEYFATCVGIIENGGRTAGDNRTTSAEGLYQFVDGSIEPAINRVLRTIPCQPWMAQVLKDKDMDKLTRDQQTLMFIADILEKRGGDKYTKSIMEGDKKAMLNAYLVLHHTNPDPATRDRAERIIYERKR